MTVAEQEEKLTRVTKRAAASLIFAGALSVLPVVAAPAGAAAQARDNGCTRLSVYYDKFPGKATLNQVSVTNICGHTIQNSRIHFWGPAGTIDHWDGSYTFLPPGLRRDYLYQHGFSRGALICAEILSGDQNVGRDCRNLD